MIDQGTQNICANDKDNVIQVCENFQNKTQVNHDPPPFYNNTPKTGEIVSEKYSQNAAVCLNSTQAENRQISGPRSLTQKNDQTIHLSTDQEKKWFIKMPFKRVSQKNPSLKNT